MERWRQVRTLYPLSERARNVRRSLREKLRCFKADLGIIGEARGVIGD